MKFTGERFIPTEQGKIRLEHYHRYAIVLDLVAKKDVLDLACGEGYGSFQMADVARSVTGIDISDEAIRHAQKTYKKTNLTFRRGTATQIDIPDASIDVVVSFETVEHLAEQTEMIAEMRRVLRPNGVLVISSPNRPIYSEENGEHNEFHVKELDFDEFDDLLKTQFSAIQYYGQRMLMGSVIQSLEGNYSAYQAWNDDGENLNPQTGDFLNPVYFVAVASADESFLPKVEPSVIYPKDLDLVKHYVGFAKWAKDLDIEITEKSKHITNLGHEIQTRDQHIINFNQTVFERDNQISKRDAEITSLNQKVSQSNQNISILNQSVNESGKQISDLNQSVIELNRQIVSLNDEIFRRGEWGLGLDAELKAEREKLDLLGKELESISKSNSWRITLPLREVKLWGVNPKQQSKRYVKKSLMLAKLLYQSLPLEIKTIEKHRRSFVKHFPKLLLTTETRLDGKERGTSSLKSSEEFNIPELPNETLFFESSAEHIENAQSIQINSCENPLVSVIIPIYGKVFYTLNCLASIAANHSQIPFEVIVVDDCSPDTSAEVLANVEGIRLIQNGQNQGFIRSCNLGANVANGKYLYFLNNDTQVTPNWMDELVRTFYEFPETGLVGSKLIYPDGRLQEAGAIIWQDGSAWNFGRFQDPNLPIYNYAREVDYCSGASIMIPKILFDELGGFDELYLPAYCEDSDIALKVRDKGYRVIYQPLSTIIHYEGITSGTDTGEGAKAYQIENSKKLYSRWKEKLSTHQIAGIDVDNAKDRRAKRRVLVLEHCTPTPNHDAGSVTVFNLLLLLREMDFQVTFIAEDNFLYVPEYTENLQRIGVEVLYAPFVTSVEQHLKEVGDRYDLVFLFRPLVVARNIKAINEHCPKAKKLYYTHDLHFLRMMREAELFQDDEKAQEAEEMKALEFDAINASDASILVSEQELEVIKDEFPKGKLHVLPLILDVPGTTKGFSERQDIVFVGGFQHTPNIDAVRYFVTEIMPLVQEQLPGVRFFAVGSKATDEIKSLASENVIITGFVEELTPLLDKMRVSVAPLRYGAGIKGKVGTAMAVGLPVVATTLAVEGMSLTDGGNILVADNPKNFTKSLVELYQDETLWNKISQNGLEFAQNAWGAEKTWMCLANIIRALDFEVNRDNRPLTLYVSSQNKSSAISTVNEDKLEVSQSESQDYKNKLLEELAIYETQLEVHNLPEIFHYWSNTHLTPIFQEAGFNSIEEFFSTNLIEAKKRTGSKSARFVSIGAGNCDLEVSIAKRLVANNCQDFILECVEINPTMLERGREMARENKVFENMRFVEADFNKWVAKKKYDAVLANQSLHHVTNLEHLFNQIKNNLLDDGSFVISDIIGRNGHQRWQESLEIVNKFWKELPESYKFNVLLNRHEKEYINWDCSQEGFEGIRAQDILPLLLERFQFEKFIGFGNVIDIFVDRCFGHHFNPKSAWDREFIDKVHAVDETGFKNGSLTPTHLMAVCVKNLHVAPFYSRSINPMIATRHP